MRTRLIHNNEYVWVPSIGRYVCANVPQGDIAPAAVYRDSLALVELHQFAVFAHDNGLTILNERGEWTADFVDYGSVPGAEADEEGPIEVLYISRPASLRQVDGRWITEGGKVAQVLLPPSGWVIASASGQLYDTVTGVPFRTTASPTDLAARSGYAYFWRKEAGDGLRAVSRECERLARTVFDFGAIYPPDFTHDNCGFRPTIRLETE
ncbi:MAG TPA: hypothetical protein VI322_00925 [Candidatus Saccharimonadia bacterium]